MINAILNMGVVVLLGWFISHYAKNNMPRLIWSGIGIYFIATSITLESLTYNPSAYFGLGLILPHFIFLFAWVREVINTIKLVFQDTYYFFITVYYKTRNTFYWFINFYEKIQAFFYGRKNKKTYEKFYKDNYTYEEPKREQKQERTYEEPKQEQKQEQTYKQKEAPKSKTKKDYGKYGRFYETDYYIVLGVNRSDDIKTIKKVWRALQKEYHTDLHHNESAEVLKKYTEITQLINNAWDEIKKEKN